jgi:hypothetical protein
MTLVRDFYALDRRSSIRMALFFWYKFYYGKIELSKFTLFCSERQLVGEYLITYAGPNYKGKL